MTIGTFDGVHLGHQALLAKAKASAEKEGLILTLMTFEPHPREFFNPKTAPPRIGLLRDQIKSWKECGVDHVIIVPFNRRSFPQISANDFVEKILIHKLQTKIIWIGDDFRYGANRTGDYNSLKRLEKTLEFRVYQLKTILHDKDYRISSTTIRQALTNGNITVANRLLGYKYKMTGRVIHGQKLGRTLGFPTLNIAIRHRRPALVGVLVVQVIGLAEKSLQGVANIGTRPTVDNSGQILLEVHVLNWSGNAYGKIITVEFLHKLHDERHYADVNQLIEGITDDVKNAKKWLIANHPKDGIQTQSSQDQAII